MVCSGERIVRFSSPIEAADQLLSLLLEAPSSSIENSLEKLIDSRISQLKVDDADKALKLGISLAETVQKSARKLYAKHNAESWSLPVDLTVKVFCMLDKQSLCRAAATCCLLNKCAKNSLCYANINLTSAVPKVNNYLVYRFVLRAGKDLRSLKIGLLMKQNLGFSGEYDQYESYPLNKTNNEEAESSFLTGSCLSYLNMGKEKAGSWLRSLHLYNIDRLDTPILCTTLSVCRSLIDLEVVGMKASLGQTLECISSNCHLIERLVLKSARNGRTQRADVSLKSIICDGLVKSCPNLSTLSLTRFKITDRQARVLMKGLVGLKFVDFSSSYSITGSFLKNLGSPLYVLEGLILRDCPHLEETKVARLLAGLLAGDFKSLRTLDVSNKHGLATSAFHYYKRCYNKRKLPLAQLKVNRPGLVVHANFPAEDHELRDDDSESDESEDSFGYGEGYGQFYFDGDSEVSESDSLREEVTTRGDLNLTDYFGVEFHNGVWS